MWYLIQICCLDILDKSLKRLSHIKSNLIYHQPIVLKKTWLSQYSLLLCCLKLLCCPVRVICRQLGLSGGRMSCCASGGSGTIWMSNLECYGTEFAIATCHHRDGMGLNTCQHSDDVYVECDGELTTVNPPPTPSPTTSSSVATQPTGKGPLSLTRHLTIARSPFCMFSF